MAVAPVCLPEADVEYSGSATISGAGAQGNKTRPNYLLALDLPIVSASSCNNLLPIRTWVSHSTTRFSYALESDTAERFRAG